MKYFPLFIITIIMLTAIEAIAQKKLNHQIAGQLPSSGVGVAGAYSGVHNDVLIVAGGANFPDKMPWEGGQKVFENNIYVFKKSTKGHLYCLENEFHLPENMAYGAAVSTPMGLFCIGGENEKGLFSKSLLLTWNKKAHKVEIQQLPDLPYPLVNSSGVFIDNSIYVVGGESENKTTSTFLKLKLGSESIRWEALPNLNKPLSHTVVSAKSQRGNTQVFMAGGRRRTESGISEFSSSLYAYSSNSNEWKTLQELPFHVSAGMGIKLNESKMLLIGGDTGKTFNKVEGLILEIAKEKNEEKKNSLIIEKARIQSTHPGFSRSVLSYSYSDNKWQIIGDIEYEVPVTTHVVRWGKTLYIVSGEIRAGVRTRDIISIRISSCSK
jgi:N-acetylneuraminate epimerase